MKNTNFYLDKQIIDYKKYASNLDIKNLEKSKLFKKFLQEEEEKA